MLEKELQELSIFIRKETEIPQVNVIDRKELKGLQAFIDHGTGNADNERSILINKIPVTIEVQDEYSNWPRVLRNIEIIQRALRDSKKHKWNILGYDRVESASNYILKLNLVIQLPIV